MEDLAVYHDTINMKAIKERTIKLLDVPPPTYTIADAHGDQIISARQAGYHLSEVSHLLERTSSVMLLV